MIFVDVRTEKTESQLLHDIEQGTKLKKVETVEKNPLPTKEGVFVLCEIPVALLLHWPYNVTVWFFLNFRY